MLKDKKKLKKIILITLIIIFGIIFLYSLYKIILWQIDNNKTKEITDNLINETNIEKIEINDLDFEDSSKRFYINVDFANLIEKNSDTVAWIEVDGTNISYPVVKAYDNDYYLYRSFDKTYNEAGWIFLDYRNNSKLTDKNNIIYGHNRMDGSMFASLINILDDDWQSNKKNYLIRTSTEYENAIWEVFSVYKIKAESYYITVNFDSDDKYLEFLNTITNRSVYDFNNDPTTNDVILTLSTCYNDFKRTVLNAKKIKSQLRCFKKFIIIIYEFFSLPK